MTINIAIAVSEGLVMAADSMTQINDSKTQQVLKNYPTAEKITELGGLPIAAMTSGIGAISQRSIMSLIREFEFKLLPTLTRTSGTSIKVQAADRPTVRDVAEKLRDFIKEKYSAVDWEAQAPPASAAVPWPPALYVVVGGYSPGSFFPEVFEVVFPDDRVTQRHPIANTPEGNPSITWWGVGTSLNRLLLGFDLAELNVAHQLLTQNLQALETGGIATRPPPPNTCLAPLADFARMRVVLDYMPLQEAVEFAEYLGQVAIGFSRFSAGVQIVGGELDVLAIQPEGLAWYKRKGFVSNMATARREVFNEAIP